MYNVHIHVKKIPIKRETLVHNWFVWWSQNNLNNIQVDVNYKCVPMNINVSIARSVYFDTRCKYHVNFLHILIQIITCCSELWFGCWKHESKFNDGELKRVWKSCNRWHICVYRCGQIRVHGVKIQHLLYIFSGLTL